MESSGIVAQVLACRGYKYLVKIDPSAVCGMDPVLAGYCAELKAQLALEPAPLYADLMLDIADLSSLAAAQHISTRNVVHRINFCVDNVARIVLEPKQGLTFPSYLTELSHEKLARLEGGVLAVLESCRVFEIECRIIGGHFLSDWDTVGVGGSDYRRLQRVLRTLRSAENLTGMIKDAKSFLDGEDQYESARRVGSHFCYILHNEKQTPGSLFKIGVSLSLEYLPQDTATQG